MYLESDHDKDTSSLSARKWMQRAGGFEVLAMRRAFLLKASRDYVFFGLLGSREYLSRLRHGKSKA
jgi:hypothetical protein